MDFLKDLDHYCAKEAPEQVKHQYLFFVANVVAKTDLKGVENTYYLEIVR